MAFCINVHHIVSICALQCLSVYTDSILHWVHEKNYNPRQCKIEIKSERILTKLRVLDYEYICNKIAKFHKQIFFITQVINIQILTTKYFSFQYSVTYCGQALRHDNAPAYEHARQSIC